MQVVHRGGVGVVRALFAPEVSGQPREIRWGCDPSVYLGSISFTDDGTKAIVPWHGGGYFSSVRLGASVGVDPPDRLTGHAAVYFCDGYTNRVTLCEGHTNATVEVGCPDHNTAVPDDTGDTHRYIEVEVLRDTAGGPQHLAWIDTDPSAPGSVNLYDYITPTSRPPDHAVFDDYRVLTIEESMVSFDDIVVNGTNYWDGVRAFITNFNEIARIRRDEQLACDYIHGLLNDGKTFKILPAFVNKRIRGYNWMRFLVNGWRPRPPEEPRKDPVP